MLYENYKGSAITADEEEKSIIDALEEAWLEWSYHDKPSDIREIRYLSHEGAWYVEMNDCEYYTVLDADDDREFLAEYDDCTYEIKIGGWKILDGSHTEIQYDEDGEVISIYDRF